MIYIYILFKVQVASQNFRIRKTLNSVSTWQKSRKKNSKLLFLNKSYQKNKLLTCIIQKLINIEKKRTTIYLSIKKVIK